jgi:hypothetical protein
MPPIASAEFSPKMGDQFSHRVEGRREANPLIDGCKRYCLDETLVLFSPEPERDFSGTGNATKLTQAILSVVSGGSPLQRAVAV